MNTLDRFGASHTHCTQGCEALDAAVDQIAESGLQLLLVSTANWGNGMRMGVAWGDSQNPTDMW